MTNYLGGKKTDEYELFLGSADKLNQITDSLNTKRDGSAKVIQYFMKIYTRNFKILDNLKNDDNQTPHLNTHYYCGLVD